jgi:GntR family transcriptional regulator
MMNTLSHDSGVPYYRQLYAILRREITDGRWRPGDRLPSEADLARTFDISRITVRQALDLLVDDGLVFRRRGSGSFVAALSVDGSNRLLSFAEDMRRRGWRGLTQVIGVRLEPATPEIAARLGIEPGAELAVIERLRLVDGKPLSLESARLVHRLCPGVLDGDYAHTPLHEALHDRYGIRLERAVQAIRAVPADAATAARLGTAVGSPLLYVERVAFRSGAPVEYVQAYWLGDRYVLFGELRA